VILGESLVSSSFGYDAGEKADRIPTCPYQPQAYQQEQEYRICLALPLGLRLIP